MRARVLRWVTMAHVLCDGDDGTCGGDGGGDGGHKGGDGDDGTCVVFIHILAEHRLPTVRVASPTLGGRAKKTAHARRSFVTRAPKNSTSTPPARWAAHCGAPKLPPAPTHAAATLACASKRASTCGCSVSRAKLWTLARETCTVRHAVQEGERESESFCLRAPRARTTDAVSLHPRGGGASLLSLMLEAG